MKSVKGKFIVGIILGIISVGSIIINYTNKEEVPYPTLYWNHQLYFITNAPVDQKLLGKPTGEIKVKLNQNKEPSNDGESNFLEVGTPFYEIAIQNTLKDFHVLAVRMSNGEYKTAYPMLNIQNGMNKSND